MHGKDTWNSRSTACAEESTFPGGFFRSTYFVPPACMQENLVN